MKHLKSRRSITTARRLNEEIIRRVDRNLMLGLISALVMIVIGVSSGAAVDQRLGDVDVNSQGLGVGAFLSALVVVLLLSGLLGAAATAIDLLRPVHTRHVKESTSIQATRLQDLVEGNSGTWRPAMWP